MPLHPSDPREYYKTNTTDLLEGGEAALRKENEVIHAYTRSKKPVVTTPENKDYLSMFTAERNGSKGQIHDVEPRLR